MKRYSIIILLLTSLVLVSCSFNKTPDITNYYILDYNSGNEDSNIRQASPFEYSVQVNETRLPRTYDRNQIISKYTFNQISYLRKHLWSAKLYDAIPSLITQRVRSYNIFKRTEREYLSDLPDYYIDSNVNSIEQYLDNEKRYAHLKIELIFRDAKTQKVIFTYNNDRIKRVYSAGIDEVVSALNDLILEETNSFSRLMISYFKTGEIPTEKIIKSLAESTKDYEEIGGNLNNVGELLVPAINNPDTEPEYFIYTQGGDFVEESPMGDVVRLQKGNYQLRIGTEQVVTEDIEILPGYRKTITPTWGALVVNILDEDRNDVKMRYEIFQENEDRVRSLGSHYSSSDRITEPQDTHILTPGRYKITINGQPYNTYTDFTTVTIAPDETYELSIVVESPDENEITVTRHLLGAGIIRAEKERLKNKFGRWNNALYIIANFNSDNTVDNERNSSITFIGESDNQYDYEKGNFHYSMKSLYSMEINWETNQNFNIKNDDYSLENTLIYNFIGGLGVYGRGDVDCHFAPTYEFFSNSQKADVAVYNTSGVLTETLSSRDKYQYQPSFFPMVLKEGIGLNYRLFQKINSVKMSVRGGIGWEQEINQNVFIKTSSSDSLYKYQAVSDDRTTGFEISTLGTVALKALPIDYTISADFLFPFDVNDTEKYDIENILTINLIKNVSWDIKASMIKGLQGKDYWVIEYGTFLRLSLFY